MAAAAAVASSPPFIPPKPEQSVKERTDTLFRTLVSSKLFSEENLQMINEWKIDFDSVVGEPEIAARRLCFLLCKVIRPVLADERVVVKQVQLLSFEEEITQILGLVLPGKDQTPEEFIENYQNDSDKQAEFFKKVAMIESFYQKQSQLLYAEANKLNEDLRAKLEAFKKRVLEINQSRIVKADEMSEKLSAVTQKMDQISKDLLNDVQTIKAMATQFSDQQTALKNLLKEAEQVITEANNGRS